MAPTKKATSRSYLRLLLLLPIPALWCVLSHFGWLDVLENYTLSLRYRDRGEIAAPVKVRYVDVDTRAIQYLGERPWDRSEFGQAARVLLETGQAKAVGFDFVFSDLAISKMISRADLQKRNFEFAKVIRAHPEIVLAAQYTSGQALLQEGQKRFPLLRLGLTDRTKNDVPELPQYPLFGPTWGTAGLIDVDYGYGRDVAPRWVPLFAQTPNPTLYHMALKLALIELGLSEKAVRLSPQQLDLVRPDGAVAVSIPLREQQLMEVNWFSKWGSAGFDPHTSLADVLLYLADLSSEKEAERTEAKKFFADFKDAIVLVGPTDPLLQDMAPTPLETEPVPKVSVHGNALKTICSGLFLTRLPETTTVAITLLLTVIVSACVAGGGVKGTMSKLAAALFLTAYVWLALWFFKQQQLILPMAAPLGAALSTSFGAIIWQLIEEEKQKGRIKGMFSAYLAPTVVNELIDSGREPELGGHEEQITAYFSDIQSFSTFSEILTPARLVELMNEYLTACTDLVQEEGGTLDKYIGDAVVAMFGAPITLPDHAYRAVTATIRVQKRIEELRQKWRSEGDNWPPRIHNLRARLGLNTGSAIIGNMGSRTRFSYTMMGDNVNLAARMESGAKSLGVYTMITDTTRTECEKHSADKIVFRFLDKIVVKGRSLPVPVHEVIGFRAEVAQQTFDCLGVHAQAMKLYLAQDWDGATRLFEQSAALEPNQPDKALALETNPSLIMIKRCHEMKEHPPGAGWDGVYEMKEK